MNTQRRKQITDAIAAIRQVHASIDYGGVLNALAEIKDDLEGARDDEQEAFEAMPEGLQAGERGQDAERSIGELDEAIGHIENFVSDWENLDEKLDDAVQSAEAAL